MATDRDCADVENKCQEKCTGEKKKVVDAVSLFYGDPTPYRKAKELVEHFSRNVVILIAFICSIECIADPTSYNYPLVQRTDGKNTTILYAANDYALSKNYRNLRLVKSEYVKDDDGNLNRVEYYDYNGTGLYLDGHKEITPCSTISKTPTVEKIDYPMLTFDVKGEENVFAGEQKIYSCDYGKEWQVSLVGDREDVIIVRDDSGATYFRKTGQTGITSEFLFSFDINGRLSVGDIKEPIDIIVWNDQSHSKRIHLWPEQALQPDITLTKTPSGLVYASLSAKPGGLVSVFYTTDGSEPRPCAEQLYSEPIQIDMSCTLKAVTYRRDQDAYDYYDHYLREMLYYAAFPEDSRSEVLVKMIDPSAVSEGEGDVKAYEPRFVDCPEGVFIDWSGWTRDCLVTDVYSDWSWVGSPSGDSYMIPLKKLSWGVTRDYQLGVHDKPLGGGYSPRETLVPFCHEWVPILFEDTNIVCYADGYDRIIDLRFCGGEKIVCSSPDDWIATSGSNGYFRITVASTIVKRTGEVVLSRPTFGNDFWMPVRIAITQDLACAPVCNLTRGPATYTDHVLLQWQAKDVYAREPGAATRSYRIYRMEKDSGMFSLITETSDTGYKDFSAEPNVVYTYKVVAVDGGIESAPRFINAERAEKKIVTQTDETIPKEGGAVKADISTTGSWRLIYADEGVSVGTHSGIGSATVTIDISEATRPYTSEIGAVFEIIEGDLVIHDFLLVRQVGCRLDVEAFEINAPDSVLSGSTFYYDCHVRYSNGKTCRVKYATGDNGYEGVGAKFNISSAPDGTSFVGLGELRAGEVGKSSGIITLTAEYEEYGVVFTATKVIKVLPQVSMTEAVEAPFEVVDRGYAWQVSADDPHVGNYCLAGEGYSGLAAKVSAGILSFWCKLIDLKDDGFLGVYINDQLVRAIRGQDAAEWTEIRVAIPFDGSNLYIAQCASGGIGAQYGVVMVDDFELQPIKLTDLVIEGIDQYDYMASINPVGLVHGEYVCHGICEGVDGSFDSLADCVWSIQGDNAEFLGESTGPTCHIRIKSGGSSETFKLVAQIDSMPGLRAELPVTVAYDAAGALDCKSLAFTQGGDWGWVGVLSDFAVGGSSVKCEQASTSGSSWIKTTVSTKGELTFWWKAESENPGEGSLELLVDGSHQVSSEDDGVWRKVTIVIEQGSHEIIWRCSGDNWASFIAYLDGVEWKPIHEVLEIKLTGADRMVADGAAQLYCKAYFDTLEPQNVLPEWRILSGDDYAFIDESGKLTAKGVAGTVEVQARFVYNGKSVEASKNVEVTVLTLEEAANCDNLTLEMQGKPWRGQFDCSHDGVSALVSPHLERGEVAVLSTKVAGPGKIAFWWKSDTYIKQDRLTFTVVGLNVDMGVYRTSISEKTGWKQVVVDLPECKEYALHWEFEQGSVYTSPLGCAQSCWVDEITWIPNQSTLTSISIEGDGAMYTDSALSLKCRAVYSDGSSRLVDPVWNIGSGSDLATIGSNGILMSGEKEGNVFLNAIFTDGNVTLSTSHLVILWKKPVDDLINSCGLEFLMGGGSKWSSQTVVSHDGVAALESGGVGENNESWMETTVDGPGRMTFWWRASSAYMELTEGEFYGARIEFYVDGVLDSEIHGMSGAWEKVSRDFTSGKHTIRWRYTKRSSYMFDKLGGDCGWLDEISWRQGSRFIESIEIVGADKISIEESESYVCMAHYSDGSEEVVSPVWNLKSAPDDTVLNNNGEMTAGKGVGGAILSARYATDDLILQVEKNIEVVGDDLSNIPWVGGTNRTSSGNKGWFVQSDCVHDGEVAFRSGAIVDRYYNSYLKTLVRGPGRISFWWKVSCSKADVLRFYVGGDYCEQISGTADDWEQKVIDLPADRFYTLEWRYVRTGSSSTAVAGEDCGWVDQIHWIPNASSKPIGITISGDSVVSGGTTMPTYRASVNFDNGTSLSLSGLSWGVWSILEPEASATIDPVSGTMRSNGDVGLRTVIAKYTEGGNTLISEYPVLIYPTEGTPDLADAIDATSLTVTTGGDADWFGQEAVSLRSGGKAAQSSGLTKTEMSWMKTVLTGPGDLTFDWNTFCSSNFTAYSRIELAIDDVVQAVKSGVDFTWEPVRIQLSAGVHIVEWRHWGLGAVWVGNVVWDALPLPATSTTPVPVEFDWLNKYPSLLLANGGNYESAALAPTGKYNSDGEPMSVWEDYVAGTDPTNKKSVFRAKIEIVEGKPVVTWEPKLDPEDASKRIYTKYGKVSLSDTDWTPIVSDDNSFRFFKVGVDMK